MAGEGISERECQDATGMEGKRLTLIDSVHATRVPATGAGPRVTVPEDVLRQFPVVFRVWYGPRQRLRQNGHCRELDAHRCYPWTSTVR